MQFGLEQLIGTYRLVVSPELLAFIERAFVDPAPPAQQSLARAEAIAEAESATLEISADGRLTSRAGAQVLYATALPQASQPWQELVFEKAPGQSVCLCMEDASTLLVLQPGKPDVSFERRPEPMTK